MSVMLSPASLASLSTFNASVNQFSTYQGYFLEEDLALKTKLKGITVFDVNADGSAKPLRQVTVWFRMPEQELRTVTYPYIMIDFLGEQIEHDREHRGQLIPYFWPYTNVPIDSSINPPVLEFPIPMTLHYQVSTFCRSSQHDRQLLSALHDPAKLPPRFGYLDTSGGTCRRLDVLSGPSSADLVDPDNKRIFRKIYHLAVSSEISPMIDMRSSRVAHLFLNLHITD